MTKFAVVRKKKHGKHLLILFSLMLSIGGKAVDIDQDTLLSVTEELPDETGVLTNKQNHYENQDHVVDFHEQVKSLQNEITHKGEGKEESTAAFEMTEEKRNEPIPGKEEKRDAELVSSSHDEQIVSLKDIFDQISTGPKNHLRRGDLTDIDLDTDSIPKDANVTATYGPFYIYNAYSKRRLYASSGYNYKSGVGAYHGSYWHSDQKWYLVSTSHNGKAAYYIINYASIRRIYGSSYYLGAYKGSKLASDQKWYLGSYTYGGKTALYFRNAYSNRKIYASTGYNFNSVWGGSSRSSLYSDELWYLYS